MKSIIVVEIQKTPTGTYKYVTDTVCPINYEIIDVMRDGVLEPSAATKLNDPSLIVNIMNTSTIGITESVITFKVKASTFNS